MLLNLWQHNVESLSVSLIKKEGYPEQEDYFPFVERSGCIYGHFVFFAKVDYSPLCPTEDTIVFNCMLYRILSVLKYYL